MSSRDGAQRPDTTREGEPTHPDNASLIAGIQIIGACTAFAIWQVERRGGGLARFDDIGLPLLGLCLAATGGAILLAPRVLAVGRVLALAVVFGYFQGSLFYALYAHGGTADGSSLNRLCQFLPLIYLASFALLIRGALILPLVHGVLTILQASMALWVVNLAMDRSTQQSLLLVIMAQPLHLVLLAWINFQRQQGMEAQRVAVKSKLVTLGMIAHELRTPLQTLVATIESLERRFKTWQLPQEEFHKLGRMRFSAAQLESYLSDLLVITKQESGLAAPRIAAVQLNLLVEEIITRYVSAVQDKGCTLEWQVDPNCHCVMTDQIRIYQIINNLLNNAVKYTRQGAIVVRVFRPEASSDWLELKVSDTGIGISPDQVASIWQPYVRVEREPSGKAIKGSGLGLAVVKLLVEILGGTIEVVSAESVGTTMTVRLPIGNAN